MLVHQVILPLGASLGGHRKHCWCLHCLAASIFDCPATSSPTLLLITLWLTPDCKEHFVSCLCFQHGEGDLGPESRLRAALHTWHRAEGLYTQGTLSMLQRWYSTLCRVCPILHQFWDTRVSHCLQIWCAQTRAAQNRISLRVAVGT